MSSLIIIMSHELTNEQVEDAKNTLGITSFIYMDDLLKDMWRNIPTELESITDYIKPIKDFILSRGNTEDFALIQGEFGAVYELVSFVKGIGMIPVYSTTKRVTIETPIKDDTIKTERIFKHVRFRKY
ncbi:UNVERIFIED_CONTAM: hypothetical protein Cloal_2200 [Acetivibrio alkalicellulosi]